METITSDRAHLQQLAETLWEERHVVEELLYRLTCARLLLAADEHRFLPAAIDEVDQVVGELREIELHREGQLADIAVELGTGEGLPSLQLLVSTAPPPYDRVFADHRTAFLRLADEVEATTRANRELASQALGRVRSSLDSLNGPAAATTSTYDAAGRVAPATVVPLRMDRVL